MKILRFEYQTRQGYGLLEGDQVKPIVGDPFQSPKTQGSLALTQVHVLAPCLPSKIIAVGLNYQDHTQEMGFSLPTEPLIFLKALSALNGPASPIRLPTQSQKVDFEGELAMVVKQRAKQISPAEAPQYLLGYSCFNDVTARDLAKKDIQFARAKSFDTFACLGPWIETDVDVRDVKIETRVNGKTLQSARTSQMIFSPPDLLSFISQVMTLEPGDVITTGTPAGVGPLSLGDVVEVDIEGIGVLSNPVEKG